MNNKGRRNELTKLKHKKRAKKYGLDPKKHYELKAQGKPCSCFLCSGDKYSRKAKHKKENQE